MLRRRAAGAVEALLAEAVVHRALLGVAEDLPRFGDFLEFSFGDRATGVAVGMVLHRLLAEGGLERLLVGVLRDAENIVIRALAHRDDRTETMTYPIPLDLPGSPRGENPLGQSSYRRRTLATVETRWAMTFGD